MKLKIEAGKFYANRNGEKGRIVCIDAPEPKYPVIGHYDTGDIITFTLKGKYRATITTSPQDLVAEWQEPRLEFRLDEPCYVRETSEHPWVAQHFSHYTAQGEPRTFKGGKTSWTSSGGDTTQWTFIRKA
jgi:hypothetical protein